jgi:signal transduction histidine kinase
MDQHLIDTHKKKLGHWLNLVGELALTSHCMCMALFSISHREMLFGNDAIRQLLKSSVPWQGLINPSFDQLLSTEQEGLIYDGLLTIGDSLSINTTVEAKVYKNEDELFVTGEINLLHMLDQNNKMTKLNQEISNLQRTLMKEKLFLANILEELRLANEQLILLNREKNQYIGMAAHDLRSPISTAISYTDILRNDDGSLNPVKKQHFLDVIEERLTFSLKLMSQLLDVSKIESGSIQLNLQKNDYVNLLRQTIEFNRLVARYKNITIDFEAQEQSFSFMFDKAKLEQVLNNLISNAIKYSPANSKVLVKLEAAEGQIRTSIIDQGLGIKSQELPNIFQPFYKASNRPTAGESTTGLGLAIAKKIVEEHGGTIEVSSEEHKGSCFRFALPVSTDD